MTMRRIFMAAIMAVTMACCRYDGQPLPLNRKNHPPVANAGADQTVIRGSTVTLNGSGSSDPDGHPLKFAWTLSTRPAGSTATLVNPSAVSPTFVADLAGEYRAQLVVNDGYVASPPDAVI